MSIKLSKKGSPACVKQVLGMTCDNASCNTVMIERLAEMLPGFSNAGHTRCFLHIINLVARSMIKQFDVPKNPTGHLSDDESQEITPEEPADEVDERLDGPAAETDLDDQDRAGRVDRNDADDEDEEIDDNVEGWTNEMTLLSRSEREHIQEDIRPVKLVLVKVINEKFV